MVEFSTGYSASIELVEAVGRRRNAELGDLADVMSKAFPNRSGLPRFDPASPADSRLPYALGHHVYETMKFAQQERNADLMRDASRLWEMAAAGSAPGRVSTAAGPVVVISKDSGTPVAGIGDMPVWTVGAEMRSSVDEELGALVADAVEVANDAGYGWLLDKCLAVVVMLVRRKAEESTSSWTVSRLPCTLYTDYYPIGALFAKDLVHESAHSWLNECIAVTGESLHGEASYWSPWKRRDRTAFGIIHSAFAFSCVTNQLTILRENSQDPVVTAYCEARVHDERARLIEAKPGIMDALGTVRSDAIRKCVEAELMAAIGTTS